jgi:hypothetical protein
MILGDSTLGVSLMIVILMTGGVIYDRNIFYKEVHWFVQKDNCRI